MNCDNCKTLRKENEELRRKNYMLTSVKGKMEIEKQGTDWILKEWVKSGDDVEPRETIVPEVKVGMLYSAIVKNCEVGEEKTCYQIAKYIGWPVWKELWAERKTYFAEYYHPLKILHHGKLVAYESKSRIVRLQ